MTLEQKRCLLKEPGDAGWWAQELLRDLGLGIDWKPTGLALSGADAWRDSGLKGISPDAPKAPLAAVADAAIAALSVVADRELDLKGRRLLGMRAMSHALGPAGRISANASCRLLNCKDGELAVNLPRADDWALLPAWLEDESVIGWESLAAALARRSQASMLERARCLGLAVAPMRQAQACSWFNAQAISPPALPQGRPFRVIDLSQLWAGPLCGFVLQRLGAEVIKIESPIRPDGAQAGPRAFYQALNAAKTILTLDVTQASGRAQFLQLLEQADLVIESARPRALQQLGLRAEQLIRPGLSWLSITGYGRADPQGEWVAFGDDAAVAGGLAWQMKELTGQAQFCGDAIADPLAGLHAALLAQWAMQAGGGYLLSVALQDVVSNALWRFEQRIKSLPASDGLPPAV